jgi:hypothetical protein
MIVTNIEDYREKQYQDYQQTLVDDETIELIKCKCCCNEVEESEIEYCVFHDVNSGKKLAYCKECIEIYKQENL